MESLLGCNFTFSWNCQYYKINSFSRKMVDTKQQTIPLFQFTSRRPCRQKKKTTKLTTTTPFPILNSGIFVFLIFIYPHSHLVAWFNLALVNHMTIVQCQARILGVSGLPTTIVVNLLSLAIRHCYQLFELFG